MAPRTYLNFDLLIERAKAGSFRVRVTGSPVGESRSTRFSLPLDSTQIENLLLKLDPGRSGTRRSAIDPQSQASMDLGGRLFEAVFNDELRLAWSRSLDVARASGQGLRLRLRLTEAPTIAGLPWELLYDRRSNNFLAQSDRTPIVRYMEVSEPPLPLRVNGPLRILVVISAPTDQVELDVESEWRDIKQALAGPQELGRIHLDRLPNATMTELAAWLRRNGVHVLHFIGHGDYDARTQDGVLYFCDVYGRSVPVSSSVLGPLLRDHDSLRLVFLNACRSARVNETDPFSGMAQGLVQQHAIAVVAMQFPITDKAAHTFAADFYEAVAEGHPIDQSVSFGRQSLLIGHQAEWATPVLFLRSPDGEIFSNILPDEAATRHETTDVTDFADLPLLASPAVVEERSPENISDDTKVMPIVEMSRDEEAPRPRRRGRQVLIAGLAMTVMAAAALVFLPVFQSGSSTNSGATPSPTTLTAPPTSTGPPSPSRTTSASSQTVVITSKALWSPTNIVVQPGDVLNLTASGSVLDNNPRKPKGTFDADGGELFPGDPLASLRHMALVGKFGSTGEPFFVGRSLTIDTRTSPDRVGVLFLGVNDTYYPDNTGDFMVVAHITGSQ